ncbi:MAG: tRNA lysidine(34) synthetase TilS [Blastocatellia bacterium]
MTPKTTVKSRSPRQSQLERHLRRALSTLGETGLVVAVSGGADSTALLDALVRARDAGRGPSTLVVAHLNHLLRGKDSDTDAVFVQELATDRGVVCEIEQADVAGIARQSRQNLEATARHLRYEFFARVARRYGLKHIVTAHTQDDQAETVLLHLLRGTGLSGLSGMPRQRPLLNREEEPLILLRPLLGVSRAVILAHCHDYQIPYRQDASNQSVDYLRNLIRHEILPRLEAVNPAIRTGLARMAELVREEDQYLEARVDEIHEWEATDGSLLLPALKGHSPVLQRRVLRRWLARRRGSLTRISSTHLTALELLLTKGQSGQSVILPGNHQVRREFERLRLFTVAPSASGSDPAGSSPVPLLPGVPCRVGGFELLLVLPVDSEAAIPDPLVSDRERSDDGRRRWSLPLPAGQLPDLLFVRTRRPGDAYRPEPGRYTFKLKTLFIRHQIPRSERDTYPVVVTSEGAIVWVPGLPVATGWTLPSPSTDDPPRAVLQVVEVPKLASQTGENQVQYRAGLKRR